MAFRSKARVAICMIAAMAPLSAQPFEFSARQKRIWRDKTVAIVVDEKGIQAEREGESRKWSWDDVQQLTLSREEVRVLTYTDSAWRGGRDRDWVFDRLPEGIATRLYPFLVSRLEARLAAEIAIVPDAPLWQVPAKLHGSFAGREGTLYRGKDTLVFETPGRDGSHTWRIQHIEAVSTAGPDDLVVTTAERRGLSRASPTDFRFQLKRPLSEERFQELWRQVNRSKGLRILQSYKGDQ